MHRTPLHELCLQIKLLELGEIEDFLAKARAPTRTRATLTMAMPTRATLTTGHTYYGHTYSKCGHSRCGP